MNADDRPGAATAARPAASSAADGPHYRIDRLDDGMVFRLARPRRLNAITVQVLDGLTGCIDELESGDARLLVIIGEGERAFCAGTDLAEAAAMDDDARIAKSRRARELFVRLARSPLVSVAAFNGLSYGGGLELGMACLLRITAAHATLSLPEIKLGLLPAYGGTQFLPALVGRGRALELMLTGRAVTAQEALAIGLVDRIGRSEEPLLDQAIDFARSVTRHGAIAVDAIRRCVDAAGTGLTDAGLAVEDAEVHRVMTSEDSKEGVAAFLEKRPPIFRGR
jgi:enoyl-CoA hydratase